VLDPAPFRGRSVLLVDDVITTGTTLDRCARVLRRAGAVEVLALCLASPGRTS
jgi:predicted amidophosphoribosyltransferase